MKARGRTQARVPSSCPPGFGPYTVVPGDTMFQLARRYQISLDVIINSNPHIPNPNVLIPGDVLCVPTPEGGRIPASCPEGYQRYTVVAGDTIERIAGRLGLDAGLIVANNPHIEDPNIIFPGDVLCVPIPIVFPCCVILESRNASLSADAQAVTLVQKLTNSNHAITFTAVSLPPPSTFGNFDQYEGFVGIPGIGGFGLVLQPVQTELPSWTGTLQFKPLLSAGNQVYVLPGNSMTGVSGSSVLSTNLNACVEDL